MIPRISAAAFVLLALGGPLNAAQAGTAPSQATAGFVDAFDDMGAPAQVTVTTEAVDIAAIEPAVETSSSVQPAIQRQLAQGVASWYGPGFAGHRTASGEAFNPADYTAAHRSLPFGSKVRVSFGGRSVVVRINDRGPFAAGRVIDLSQAAAEQIGLRRAGSGRVELALLDS